MQLDLQSRPFTMTAALKHAVRTQLARLQARFGDWLHYARVRLEDVNGPRGGVDKRCRMVFGLPQMQPIVVQARSETCTRRSTRPADAPSRRWTAS